MTVHTSPDRSLGAGTLLRGLALAAGVALWWTLAGRNEALRLEEKQAAARAQLALEIRSFENALLESRQGLPEPGTGDPRWWKDRLSGQASRSHLAITRFDAKLSELALGPYTLQRLEIVLEGSFESFLGYLAWLETASPRVRIERFAIEASRPGWVRATILVLCPSATPGR